MSETPQPSSVTSPRWLRIVPASRPADLEAEHADLLRGSARAPDLAARARKARYELRLVEERLTQLRRQEVAACRLTPSVPIREALGPYPKKGLELARAWDDGADLIHGFRLRHGVTSIEGHPLGPASGAARAGGGGARDRAAAVGMWAGEAASRSFSRRNRHSYGGASLRWTQWAKGMSREMKTR